MYPRTFFVVVVSALTLTTTASPTLRKRVHLLAPRDHIRYTNLNGTALNSTSPTLYFDGSIKFCPAINTGGDCVEMSIADPGTGGMPTCNVIDIPGNPDVRSLYIDAPLMKSWTCRFFRADQEKMCDHSVDYIEKTGQVGVMWDGRDIENDLDLSKSEEGPRGNWTNNVGQVLCMGTLL